MNFFFLFSMHAQKLHMYAIILKCCHSTVILRNRCFLLLILHFSESLNIKIVQHIRPMPNYPQRRRCGSVLFL